MPTATPQKYLLAEIACNEGESFSGVVIRPGINGNGYFYSPGDVATIVGQLPGRPLVKDHNLSVDAVIGKFIGSETRPDGSGLGKFTISPSEPQLLAKVKDHTLEYLSVGHNYSRSYCTVCNTAITNGKYGCDHVAFREYDGKIASEAFEGIQVGHVALVQTPADYGCKVVQNSFMAQVKCLADEVVRLRDLNAETAGKLKATETEITRLKAVRIPEPPSQVVKDSPKPVGQGEKIAQTWVEKIYG